MGLWNATKSLFAGEGKQSLDYLFVDEDVIAQDTITTTKLDALNRRDLEEHSISEQEYRERLARLTNTAFPDFVGPDGHEGRLFDDPAMSPAAGFGEGLQEGADNIRNTITKVATGSIGLTLRLIPWWVKIGVVAYLVFITFPIWGGALGARALLKK